MPNLFQIGKIFVDRQTDVQTDIETG